MVNGSTQPTVLVKKADGTFVRVSLDELKNKKSVAVPTNEPVSVAPVAAPTSVSMSAPVVMPAPVVNQPVATTKLENEKSLLEEDEPLPTSLQKLSDKRLDQADTVIKKLSFVVPANWQNRLRSAIQLRLKDIRSEDEFRDISLRSIKEGGLGLTEIQAEELVNACKLTMLSQNNNQGELESLFAKRSLVGASLVRNDSEKMLPMVEPNEIPAISTPFNAFIHAPKKTVLPPAQSSAKPVELKPSPAPQFKISPRPVIKNPPMQDIIGKSITVSPVEEISRFTLTDFRRLSDKPTESANRLKQKFLNLKEEFIGLYFDGVAAWKSCPLYQDYLNAVGTAVNKKIPLANLVASGQGIKMEEIKAIIEMEKELGL
ncbi:MAG: hypothetical protein UR53_C0003G0007 [Candidatus Magasanikbacteria bacterium GW2011_GWC2_34_16]|uniref:Uncharacterized protein n=2 Tax=Candidatus Magasanikiibacteriota TaxID=1752731 RepID=A0A0G0HDN8_9BACT|nr:MAG: hypothetical protein UR53_C0003G0007 [Candidatus Magasanikbacteria bacterium GW2011_GWC2_34_16]KKQ41283.1 MAG: hypothetical protein US58_C0002G0006 [Candidatus Magasanikbacteria bacterium GW2011_GWA2_37_8]